jgi:molybdopterin/thiamine biosynthesis adenylyltransferase
LVEEKWHSFRTLTEPLTLTLLSSKKVIYSLNKMLVTYKLAASFLAICSITKASLTPMSSTSIPPSSGRVIRQNSALSQFLSDGSVASNEVDDRMRSRSSVDSTGTPSVAESEGSAEHVEDAIDEGLYSRQLYVLGRDAQRALQKAKVLVVGCTGPGVELAKNVALAGVAELCLCDPAPVQWHDLASHFYATPADVAAGTSRAEAAARHVASLNPHVKITIVVPPVDADATVAALGGDITAVAATAMVASGEWAVVVAVDQPEDVQLSMNDAARGKTASVASTDGKRSTKKNPTTSDEGAGGAAPCAFIACNARGVFGNVFCDFGDIFIVRDPTGTPPEPKPLDDVRALYQPRKITGASAATTSSTGAVQEHEECVEVEVVEGERHCLSAGQRVHLADLTWAPAPPQAPSGDETAPAVPHSGSDRGSREGFPSELTGTVTRLKGPAVAVVRLDNIPGQSTPAGATVAAGAAAWSGKLASGSVVRPKSDEAWKVPFQPLRALLKRPAVAPVRPRRPKKGSPEAIQAAAVEAAAKAAGTTKLEPVKVEPCPMVPCDFAKSADRNRVATIHACWHFALPRFLENAKHDGTGSSKFAGGTTAKVATEQAAARAEFLDNVKAAFAEESEKPGGGALGSGVEVDLATARAFAHCVVAGTGSGTGSAAVCLAPVASFVGGVAAQEVLKAVSRVFNPVEQFLYFDAVEALPPLPDDDDSDVVPASESTSGKSGDSLSENVDVSEEDAGSGDGNESEGDESDEEDDDGDDDDEDDSSADESAEGNESEDDNETEQDSDLSSSSYAASFAPRGDRYDGARSLLGAAVCQDLAQQRWFMVGAGAIGCELLKNLALLGVATSSGWLAITDMDTIERSNLNRQFLFRSSDVGKAKAVAAAEACRRLNEHVVLRTWQTAVRMKRK